MENADMSYSKTDLLYFSAYEPEQFANIIQTDYDAYLLAKEMKLIAPDPKIEFRSKWIKFKNFLQIGNPTPENLTLNNNTEKLIEGAAIVFLLFCLGTTVGSIGDTEQPTKNFINKLRKDWNLHLVGFLHGVNGKDGFKSYFPGIDFKDRKNADFVFIYTEGNNPKLKMWIIEAKSKSEIHRGLTQLNDTRIILQDYLKEHPEIGPIQLTRMMLTYTSQKKIEQLGIKRDSNNILTGPLIQSINFGGYPVYGYLLNELK